MTLDEYKEELLKQNGVTERHLLGSLGSEDMTSQPQLDGAVQGTVGAPQQQQAPQSSVQPMGLQPGLLGGTAQATLQAQGVKNQQALQGMQAQSQQGLAEAMQSSNASQAQRDSQMQETEAQASQALQQAEQERQRQAQGVGGLIATAIKMYTPFKGFGAMFGGKK